MYTGSASTPPTARCSSPPTVLFRSPEGSTQAERVGSSTQDAMGFTVVGPDRFLGSGHPGPAEEGPSSLGLIESSDAGQSWSAVSLAGQADFHVLRYAQDCVYAANALTGELMLSDDGGESRQRRQPPAPAIDLAIDPRDPERLVVSTEAGLALSDDGGRSWLADQPRRRRPGMAHKEASLPRQRRR